LYVRLIECDVELQTLDGLGSIWALVPQKEKPAFLPKRGKGRHFEITFMSVCPKFHIWGHLTYFHQSWVERDVADGISTPRFCNFLRSVISPLRKRCTVRQMRQ